MFDSISKYCTRRKWKFFREAIVVKNRLEKYANMRVPMTFDEEYRILKGCQILAKHKLGECFSSPDKVWYGGYRDAKSILAGLDKVVKEFRE